MRTNNFHAWAFSPAIVYLLGFVMPFLLVFVGFSKHVPYPSVDTIKVIICGIVGFYLGLILVSLFFNYYIKNSIINRVSDKIIIVNEGLLFKLLLLLWLIGIAMLWFEFYQLGSLPLLSDNVEELRFKLQFNGYTHLLAISSGFTSFIFFALYLISDDNFFKRSYLILILIAIASLVMTANRIDFMYPLFLMILFYVIYAGKALTKKVFLYLAVGLVVFVALNIFRSSGYSDDYISNNYSGLGFGFEPSWLNLALYPFYMTLTYSFEMLNKLVNTGVEGVTNGLYTFYAFVSLEPGYQESFGEFKNRMLNIDFYAELTSTYLSNFYVDFGIVGVFFCSLIYAFFVQIAWSALKVSKVYVLIYIVIIAPIFLLFYVFYYIYFYAFFQVGIILFVTFFLKNNTPKEV